MSIGPPQVIYTPVATPITLAFQHGPQHFLPKYAGRVHDNISTAGFRERVTEALDIIITFTMGFMAVSDPTDFTAWGLFMAFALAGGQFQFYPNINIIGEYYDCVVDDQGWEPKRVGPGRYSADLTFRVLPDAQSPAGGPAQVMRRFYGITT